jgi:hypothetical protein
LKMRKKEKSCKSCGKGNGTIFFSSEEKNKDEHFANYRQKPGTDVIILKKNSPKNSANNWHFCLKTKLNCAQFCS